VTVDCVSAAKNVVLSSDALAVSLPHLIERQILSGDLVLLPVNLPWMRLRYGFLWRRDRTLPPAAIAFMNLVREIERETPQ